MAWCNKCNNNRCTGSYGKKSITRQIRINNSSIGRDGESAYEAYVRLGGTLTEQEWAFLNESNVYEEDNWI